MKKNLNPLYESTKKTASSAVKKIFSKSPFERRFVQQQLERHIAEQPMIGSLIGSNGKEVLINLGKLGNAEVRELRGQIYNLQKELSKTIDPLAIENLKSKIATLTKRLEALS